MKDNKIIEIDFKKEQTYKEDFTNITNELKDKTKLLFNQYIDLVFADNTLIENVEMILHFIYLTSCVERYYQNDFYCSLDNCVYDLLAVYKLCNMRDELYKEEYAEYKQSDDYQEVQRVLNNPLN